MSQSVAINSTDYDTYASVSQADAYLDASSHADTWRALDDVSKARMLVTATRVIDRQQLKGERADPLQVLAFPRINLGFTPLEDHDGVPLDVVYASIELALAIADGSEVQASQDTDDRVRSFSAGSVSISMVRGSAIPTRFPQIVQELLVAYLGSSLVDGFGAKVTGVDRTTIFPLELGYNTGGM